MSRKIYLTRMLHRLFSLLRKRKEPPMLVRISSSYCRFRMILYVSSFSEIVCFLTMDVFSFALISCLISCGFRTPGRPGHQTDVPQSSYSVGTADRCEVDRRLPGRLSFILLLAKDLVFACFRPFCVLQDGNEKREEIS